MRGNGAHVVSTGSASDGCDLLIRWSGAPRRARGKPCEGRFWERKLGPAKAYYLWGLADLEGPHI